MGKRAALPGSATFRLQSQLSWEKMADGLWNMMCGNTGVYFCEFSGRYKSWWQDPWAQQEDTNGRSMHSLLHFYSPWHLAFCPSLPPLFSFLRSAFTLPYISPPPTHHPFFFFFFLLNTRSGQVKTQLLWRTGIKKPFYTSSLGVFMKPVRRWLTTAVPKQAPALP